MLFVAVGLGALTLGAVAPAASPAALRSPVAVVPTAPAAAAVPGVPADPSVLFEEDFENADTHPVLLTDYTGVGGATYTADPEWLSSCNGQVVQFSTPQSDFAASNCQVTGGEHAFNRVRQLARALASVNGGDPLANHALAAYTQGADPGPDHVELATAAPVGLPPGLSSRFVLVQVNVAALNCASFASPDYRFSFFGDDGDVVLVGDTPEGCDTSTVVDSVPGAPTNPDGLPVNSVATNVRVGTVTSPAVLFSGQTLGVEMRNLTGTSAGNDAAVDDLRVLDVTPALDTAFDPPLVGTGQESRLTFTVTNTAELAAKGGFAFTDYLPAGLVIAPTPDFGSTCVPASITDGGTPGAGSLSIVGSLSGGQASCTIWVDVVSASEGTFVNAPGPNVGQEVGLVPPPPAILEVRDPRLRLVKALDGDRFDAGDQFTVVIRRGGPGGAVVSDPARATTTGSGPTVTPGTGTTGDVQAEAGRTYTLAETPAGSTNLERYAATLSCSDARGLQTNLPTDVPAASGVAITPHAGADVRCVLTNRALRPGLRLDKRVDMVADVDHDGLTGRGDTITWAFRLTNSGVVPLTDPGVDDPLAGPVICPPGPLAPGGTMTCRPHASYVVSQADVDRGRVRNVATARAEGPGGDPAAAADDVVSEPDQTSTPTSQVSGLRLDKRVARIVDSDGDGVTDAGDTIEWEFDVTNSGSVTVELPRIDDPFLHEAGLSVRCPGRLLTAGDSVTCHAAPYEVTQADAVAGRIVNVATAAGLARGGADGTGGAAVRSDADETVTATRSAGASGAGPDGPAGVVLPATGGPSLLWPLLGLALVGVGGWLVRHGSRRRVVG